MSTVHTTPVISTLRNVHNTLDGRQGFLVVAFHAPQRFDKLKVPRALLLELLEPFPNAIRNHQLCAVVLW